MRGIEFKCIVARNLASSIYSQSVPDDDGERYSGPQVPDSSRIGEFRDSQLSASAFLLFRAFNENGHIFSVPSSFSLSFTFFFSIFRKILISLNSSCTFCFDTFSRRSQHTSAVGRFKFQQVMKTYNCF